MPSIPAVSRERSTGARNSVILLILAASLAAQQPPATSGQQAPAGETQEATRQPEYAGPAISSRGVGSIFRQPWRPLRFRPFLAINGSYDSGITGVLLTADGQPPDDSSIGGDITAGITGYQTWKRTLLSLAYSGSYQHYARHTYYNGSEQSLALTLARQATRRVTFTMREAAGIYSRRFGFFDGYGYLDPAFTNVPRDELFDGRTMYLNTLGDLTYQKSARLSFNIAGDGFLVRRRSGALFGVTGYRARADVAYRVSRFSTTGVAYDYSHFEFTKAFGGSDIQTVGLVQSMRLSRWWELSMRLGAARVETLGIARVAIDPVIAAILGQSYGVEAVYRINYMPNGNIQLTRGFRRASLTLHYQHGVSPGNGLYLTSRMVTGGAGFSYSGLRNWAVSVSGDYSSYSSLAQNIGNYESKAGGVHASRRLGAGLHLTTRAEIRDFAVAGTKFARTMYRLGVGFAYSPGDVPLSIW